MHLVEQLECPFADKLSSKGCAHWKPVMAEYNYLNKKNTTVTVH